MSTKEYLRIVIERDDEGGIKAVWIDGAAVPVEVWIADENLDNAEHVADVEGIAYDLWAMDTIRSEADVARFLDATRDEDAIEELLNESMAEDDLDYEEPGWILPELDEEPEPDYPPIEIIPELELLAEAPTEGGDNPHCDYCGIFVGYGLREDFPKLACANCDRA